jgi:hypothetical protein
MLLLMMSKRIFEFYINSTFHKFIVVESEVKEFIWKVENESRFRHNLEDWIRLRDGGAFPQNVGGSNNTFEEFIIYMKLMTRSLELRIFDNPEKNRTICRRLG